MAAGNSYKQPFWQWNSPLPYLFGGLGLMFALILVALLILACTYRKIRSTSDDVDDEVKSVKPIRALAPVTMPPQIVVIMAGGENPTHLAVPVTTATFQPNLCANCNAGNHRDAAVDGGDVAEEATPPAMQLV